MVVAEPGRRISQRGPLLGGEPQTADFKSTRASLEVNSVVSLLSPESDVLSQARPDEHRAQCYSKAIH